MAIMVIIITIRANHWSFQSENYPSLTCLSPETAPKCPYYHHHQGHTVRVRVCLIVCMCVSSPLTPKPHSCFEALRRAPSPFVSTGTMAPESALCRELPWPVSLWNGVFCAAQGHCVSVRGPAGLSAKTSSQSACSQWAGKPRCCIWDSQGWSLCVCVCVCECHYGGVFESGKSMVLSLGAFFQPRDEMGKLSK